jgi:phenylacetate-coenzyme A ligase PaaK-like adenylate-forming protein
MVRLAPGACPCGRVYSLIDGIQGRQEEVLALPGPDGRSVRIHPNVFHEALELLALAGWQVVQRGGGLTLFLEGMENPAIATAVRQAVVTALSKMGVKGTPVGIQWVTTIPRGPSGKAPLIRSEA